MSGPDATRVDVLGIPVTAWTIPDLLDCVVHWAKTESVHPRTVLYVNAHVLNTAYREPGLREALRSATSVYCDGSGARLGAWILGRQLPPRLTGADWIDPLCRRASKERLSLFVLGSAAGVAPHAAHLLKARHPGLQIVGAHHGYLDGTNTDDVIGAVNASSADVLLVGMGTPRQELWITQNRARLRLPVVWAVGALFDFVAGVEPRGPAWMLDHHLEWAARLWANPARLWRRYLIGNPLFVGRVLRQRFVGLPARASSADTHVPP